MIEAIVFLWLLLLIFIDIRVRAVEKHLDKLEKKLLKEKKSYSSEIS
jgi:hypothetical protein